MAEQLKLTVDATNVSHPLGDLYGAFFEDLNHAADGGLYAELVQNRAFEFDKIDNWNYHSLTAYHTVGGVTRDELTEEGAEQVQVTVETKEPVSQKNPHYAVVTVTGGVGGLCNEGFHGIPLADGENYFFSVWAKGDAGKDIYVRLVKQTARCLWNSHLP